MTANMAIALVPARQRSPEIVVALHTEMPPSEAEWRTWIALLRSRAEAVHWDLSLVGNLVITDGGGPDREQRMLIDMLVSQSSRPPHVAIVTDSLLVRTIVRGLSVFNPNVQVFAPVSFDAALAFLGIEPVERPSVLKLCADAVDSKIGAGAVHTLRALLDAPGQT